MRDFLIALIGAALVMLPATDAAAWGATGHRATGAMAERHLTGAAAAEVRTLLEPGESLAIASTWADFVRVDPAWRHASPWHYVTTLDGVYSGSPPQGDAVSALAAFTATLRDRGASRTDRRAALRWIVHIVGDLHQPLHVGCRDDKGGNSHRVTWFGDATNLHTVWDSKIIDQDGLSYSELAATLGDGITPDQAAAWATTDPLVWVGESATLCAAVYPDKASLGYRYVFDNQATAHRRLQQAGIRIAATLNAALSP